MVPGVDGVDDELRVQPTEKRGDDTIIDAVVKTMMSEPVFRDYTLLKQAHHSEPINGRLIIVNVNDAVVRLVGQVESLTHKRLADVLAWWTSGVADVDNRLRVFPGQMDTDSEINDSLRIVLEKDPSLNPDEIRAETRDHVIYLNGVVHNETEREIAERDAWCILGVHEVTNALEVRP
jgi:osmotically-inducible protein OsmY